MTNLILRSLSRLHKDEAGQGLVEYALILALVAFGAVIAMKTLANDIIHRHWYGAQHLRPVVAGKTTVSACPGFCARS